MKFPPYIDKYLSEVIKIDKPREKGSTFFKLFIDIFT